MKRFLKLFFIAILPLVACKSVSKQQDLRSPFTIQKATYKNWAGGQPGVSGTIVTLELKDLEKQVQLDSIYFLNKKTNIEKDKNSTTKFYGHFYTSTRQDLYNYPKESNDSKQKINFKLPVNLKENEALLYYSFKKKISYEKVVLTKANPQENALKIQ